jgi:hypothetical protein
MKSVKAHTSSSPLHAAKSTAENSVGAAFIGSSSVRQGGEVEDSILFSMNDQNVTSESKGVSIDIPRAKLRNTVGRVSCSTG